jgi:hypothetical protein
VCRVCRDSQVCRVWRCERVQGLQEGLAIGEVGDLGLNAGQPLSEVRLCGIHRGQAQF